MKKIQMYFTCVVISQTIGSSFLAAQSAVCYETVRGVRMRIDIQSFYKSCMGPRTVKNTFYEEHFGQCAELITDSFSTTDIRKFNRFRPFSYIQ
jgi:hypothetical protein